MKRENKSDSIVKITMLWKGHKKLMSSDAYVALTILFKHSTVRRNKVMHW